MQEAGRFGNEDNLANIYLLRAGLPDLLIFLKTPNLFFSKKAANFWRFLLKLLKNKFFIVTIFNVSIMSLNIRIVVKFQQWISYVLIFDWNSCECMWSLI